jgi:hypothetical protein
VSTDTTVVMGLGYGLSGVRGLRSLQAGFRTGRLAVRSTTSGTELTPRVSRKL